MNVDEDKACTLKNKLDEFFLDKLLHLIFDVDFEFDQPYKGPYIKYNKIRLFFDQRNELLNMKNGNKERMKYKIDIDPHIDWSKYD